MSGGGPRAGSCVDSALEKYLIATVKAAPSNSNSTHRGISPRLYRVTPSDANRQPGIQVRLEGMLRNYNTMTTAPTLSLRSMDLGSAPNSYSFNSRVSSFIERSSNAGYIGTGGNADIFIEIAKKRSVSAGLNRFASVPRFGVKRGSYTYAESATLTDIDYIGVTTNFDRFGDAIPAVPSAFSGTWTVVGQPRMVESSDGVQYLFHVALKSTGEFDLIVSKFDPKIDFGFTTFSTLFTSSTKYMAEGFNFAQWATAASAVDVVGIAPVRFGNAVYCVICMLDTGSNLGYLGTAEIRDGDTSVRYVYGSSPDDTLGVDTLGVAKVTPLGVELISDDDKNVDSPPSTMTVNPLTRFGGIDAVEYDGRVRVAVGVKCPGYCSEEKTRTVAYVDTTDFNIWSDDDEGSTTYLNPQADILSLDGWNLTSQETTNAIYRTTSAIFACGENGSIYKSINGGASWVRKTTGLEPEYLSTTVAKNFGLFAISGDGGSVIYAAGAFGTVIKSSDGGESWSVIRTGAVKGSFLYGSAGGSSAFAPDSVFVDNTSNIRGIALKSATELWICGDSGLIEYSSNGGTSWTTIVNAKSNVRVSGGFFVSPGYNAILYEADNTIIAVGSPETHSIPQITKNKDKRAIRIKNATAAKNYNSGDVEFFLSQSEPTSVLGKRPAPLVAIKKTVNGSTIATLDSDGYFYIWDSGNEEFNYRHRVPIGNGSAANFHYASASLVYVIANYGTNQAKIFRNLTFDLSTSYRSMGLAIGRVSEINMNNEDEGVVVGSGIVAMNERLAQRTRPRFVRLPNGKLKMIVQNLETAKIEDFQFNDGTSFADKITDISTFKNDSLLTSGEFDPTKGLGSIGLHTAIIDEEDTVFVSHPNGQGTGPNTSVEIRSASRAVDGYTTWVDGGSRTKAALPLGIFPTDSADYTTGTGNFMERTRDMIWFSRGRIFGTIVKSDRSDIGIFATREFKAPTAENPTNFPPIIPGKWQWSGIDSIMVKFSGFPLPGDTFDAESTFSYALPNIVTESPSVYWRGPAVVSGSVTAANVTWNNSDELLSSKTGVSAAALFGINFKEFYFGYATSTAGPYTEVYVNQNLQSGTMTAPNGTSSYESFIDSSANMVPSQYKLGAGRTWYFKVTSGTQSGRVFKITDNDRNVVYFKNGSSVIPNGSTYEIFSDRTFADATSILTDAQRANIGSIRIRIPSQQTVDRYFKIGTAIIGRYVTYDPYEGNESRRRFSEGFGWRPIPSTVLQRGESGVSSVEHIGFQRAWTLPYEAMQWWDRDMQMNGLMPEMRQAFAIMFNGDDTNSLYLVRLVDGPETTNAYQDRYSFAYQLEEVV